MYPTRAFLAGSLLMLAAVSVLVAGCYVGDTTIYNCPNPIFGRKDHTGHADECCEVDPCDVDAGTDAGDASAATDAAVEAGPICEGDCVPVPPTGWSSLGLFWAGPEGTAPACPDLAPVLGFEAHADLDVPAGGACSACTCSPSAGTCGPPLHMGASAETCSMNGPTSAPFEPPANWDGSCTAANAIAEKAQCGGVDCVLSLTSAPLELTEQGCAPSIAILNEGPLPSWKTAARECLGSMSPLGSCADHGLVCAPRAAAGPSGFLTCIFQDGDQVCPESYPDKHIVYSSFEDQRGCAPCACEPPADSVCTGRLAVYKDMACADLLDYLLLSSAGPTCNDLLPGLPLGSKDVDKLTYQSGTCAPTGGEPTGAVIPSAPSTFCCLPPP